MLFINSEQLDVGGFVFDDAEGSAAIVDLVCPVGVGADLVHLVAAGALDHSAAGSEDLTGVVILLFGHCHEGVDELDVGGMDDGAADEAVGLVQDDFAEQTVDLVVDHGFAAHEVVLEAMLGKLLEHELFRGTEIFPDGAGDHVVVVSGAYIDDIGKALADDHDVIQGVVDTSADTEDGAEVCSADTDLQDEAVIFIKDLSDADQLADAGLFVGDLGILDDGHAVEDFVELLVEIQQIGEVFVAVLSVEFGEVDATEGSGLFFGQLAAKGFELGEVADPDKDQGNEVTIQPAAVNGVGHCSEQGVDVFHGFRYALLGAGVLKVQDHRGQTGHGIVKDLFKEILVAGHIHGRAQAVLQEIPLCIFIEMFRFDYKRKIRIIALMSHGELVSS